MGSPPEQSQPADAPTDAETTTEGAKADQTAAEKPTSPEDKPATEKPATAKDATETPVEEKKE